MSLSIDVARQRLGGCKNFHSPPDAIKSSARWSRWRWAHNAAERAVIINKHYKIVCCRSRSLSNNEVPIYSPFQKYRLEGAQKIQKGIMWAWPPPTPLKWFVMPAWKLPCSVFIDLSCPPSAVSYRNRGWPKCKGKYPQSWQLLRHSAPTCNVSKNVNTTLSV